ncbi:MAG: 50S ribosome-binding GTPase, partial [Planctomycetales bacterium]|nr:50S ribosome-binding GTPase [Planctomycetales bacterium]
PLLEAALRTLCDNGARLAEPGEFTLRAFLAGRLDLTQAEAVLGVIDARGSDALQTALQQLSGGLTKPLTSLRVSLIDLLADLEAGLDFVEEDIEFISREDMMQRVTFAANEVRMLIERLARRGSSGAVPRVVLVGPPNSGKSSLFNALLDRFGMDSAEPALISDVPGTTRDYLAARLDLQGQQCELIDTAGVEEVLTADSIAAAAQEMTHDQGRQADFRLQCIDATRFDFIDTFGGEDLLTVYTKADLHSPSQEAGVVTSAQTGAGLDALAEELRRRIRDLAAETHTGMVAATSARCEESLRAASDGLDRVLDLLHRAAGEELLAAEIREVLT